ncbi:hypothetical protein BB561_000858 [Smittium simulii]|uniref:Enhancer of mRNA-decapping protein 4 WD40 repeat region domain-containing protein n=1 Tax=Smittium simulii TaxID=133385 RepID=A0A2T9YX74_9FUNG|nr:hypothetical protein BB561_000858 [Smittium simulii]
MNENSQENINNKNMLLKLLGSNTFFATKPNIETSISLDNSLSSADSKKPANVTTFDQLLALSTKSASESFSPNQGGHQAAKTENSTKAKSNTANVEQNNRNGLISSASPSNSQQNEARKLLALLKNPQIFKKEQDSLVADEKSILKNNLNSAESISDDHQKADASISNITTKFQNPFNAYLHDLNELSDNRNLDLQSGEPSDSNSNKDSNFLNSKSDLNFFTNEDDTFKKRRQNKIVTIPYGNDSIQSKSHNIETVAIVSSTTNPSKKRAIAASKYFICYGKRGGDIRLIQQYGPLRGLFLSHKSHVVFIKFHSQLTNDSNATQLMVSADRNNNVVFWGLSADNSVDDDLALQQNNSKLSNQSDLMQTIEYFRFTVNCNSLIIDIVWCPELFIDPETQLVFYSIAIITSKKLYLLSCAQDSISKKFTLVNTRSLSTEDSFSALIWIKRNSGWDVLVSTESGTLLQILGTKTSKGITLQSKCLSSKIGNNINYLAWVSPQTPEEGLGNLIIGRQDKTDFELRWLGPKDGKIGNYLKHVEQSLSFGSAESSNQTAFSIIYNDSTRTLIFSPSFKPSLIFVPIVAAQSSNGKLCFGDSNSALNSLIVSPINQEINASTKGVTEVCIESESSIINMDAVIEADSEKKNILVIYCVAKNSISQIQMPTINPSKEPNYEQLDFADVVNEKNLSTLGWDFSSIDLYKLKKGINSKIEANESKPTITENRSNMNQIPQIQNLSILSDQKEANSNSNPHKSLLPISLKNDISSRLQLSDKTYKNKSSDKQFQQKNAGNDNCTTDRSLALKQTNSTSNENLNSLMSHQIGNQSISPSIKNTKNNSKLGSDMSQNSVTNNDSTRKNLLQQSMNTAIININYEEIVSKSIEKSIEKYLSSDDFKAKLLLQIQPNIESAFEHSIKATIQKTVETIFENSLIPSYNNVTQEMLSQVGEFVNNGFLQLTKSMESNISNIIAENFSDNTKNQQLNTSLANATPQQKQQFNNFNSGNLFSNFINSDNIAALGLNQHTYMDLKNMPQQVSNPFPPADQNQVPILGMYPPGMPFPNFPNSISHNISKNQLGVSPNGINFNGQQMMNVQHMENNTQMFSNNNQIPVPHHNIQHNQPNMQSDPRIDSLKSLLNFGGVMKGDQQNEKLTPKNNSVFLQDSYLQPPEVINNNSIKQPLAKGLHNNKVGILSDTEMPIPRLADKSNPRIASGHNSSSDMGGNYNQNINTESSNVERYVGSNQATAGFDIPASHPNPSIVQKEIIRALDACNDPRDIITLILSSNMQYENQTDSKALNTLFILYSTIEKLDENKLPIDTKNLDIPFLFSLIYALTRNTDLAKSNTELMAKWVHIILTKLKKSNIILGNQFGWNTVTYSPNDKLTGSLLHDESQINGFLENLKSIELANCLLESGANDANTNDLKESILPVRKVVLGCLYELSDSLEDCILDEQVRLLAKIQTSIRLVEFIR